MINLDTSKGITNSIEQIARDIEKRKDYVIAMEFTKNIATLLRENGVTINLTQIQEPIQSDENSISMKYGVCFSGCDFTEHDKKVMDKFIDNKINQCILTTCRYNVDKKCVNQNKRKESIEVSEKVLCLEKYNKNPFNICETNPNCENAGNCKYAIECTTFEDLGNAITRYINGFKKCPYNNI